jgi:methionyl-tRNA synthetase
MSEKYIVTSALPYANGILHIGHLAGSLLPADIFYRYLKLKGKDVIFICGDDEHGTPIEVAAQKEGKTPKEYCDKIHEERLKIFKKWNLGFTCYGRTSDKENHELTQYFFKKLYENGYIFEQEIEMPYCPKCKRFLPDRYLIGICPKCGKETKGDQCDCGYLIEDTKEIIDPKCSICGSKPEWRKTKHLFLDLPRFKEDLKKWIESNKHWRKFVRNWALSLVDDIKPRCITRDIEWGVKVPLEGYEDKVFYVWFDAPIGYISISKKIGYEDWWKDKNTKVYHFLGKDNIPFHTIIWPAMLMGVEDYVLPYDVPAQNYLVWEKGQKMSKSKKIGVFLDEIDQYPFHPDVWRYVLARLLPDTKDTEFTWDLFYEIYSELSDVYGNLVRRIVVLANKIGSEDGNFKEVSKRLEEKENEYYKLMDEIRLRESLIVLMDMLRDLNAFLNEKEPWKTKDKKVIGFVEKWVLKVSELLKPFIPELSEKVIESIKTKKPIILIKKIPKEEFDKIVKGDKMNEKQNYIEYKDFEKLDLRIAKIVECEEVKESKKLLKIVLDLGGEKRVVMSGIKEYYKPEDLIGKKIVYLSNLKPKKIFGVESQGMILAAEDEEGNVSVLIPLNEKIKEGSRIL